MDVEFFSAAVVLLLVLDPLGNVPVVMAVLHNVAAARRRRVIVRECLLAYAILVLFMIGGKGFLAMLQLSEAALSIAGGIVLFLIALRMVFPRPEGVFGLTAGEDPLLVPLATPAIAGPSALATVMLLASREPERLWLWLGALTVAMALTTLVLVYAERLEQWLGRRVIVAFEGLAGLVLTALAVQMLLTGVRGFVRELAV